MASRLRVQPLYWTYLEIISPEQINNSPRAPKTTIDLEMIFKNLNQLFKYIYIFNFLFLHTHTHIYTHLFKKILLMLAAGFFIMGCIQFIFCGDRRSV